MGWCSATRIFDAVCGGLIGDNPKSTKDVIRELVISLEDRDWDCHDESGFWMHPIVQEVMRELHPHWFDEEE